MSKKNKNQAVMKEAAAEVVKEVEILNITQQMDEERKSRFNKVMDAIEEFETTLELEHDSLGSGTWDMIKKIMYKIARAAIYSSKKGLEYLHSFIVWAEKQLRKADVAGRISRAWETLTSKKDKEVLVEAAA